MSEKQSYLGTPATLAVMIIAAVWTAASSGTAPYARVLACVWAGGAAVNLVLLLVRRRRDLRAATQAAADGADAKDAEGARNAADAKAAADADR
ncbi:MULTISPECIES: hypothetical protein [Streptomyces]|uniref:Integral membrane protein n=1 Tax=Streptomyces californicus TaxID=67351 RepID=A0ABD7CXG6_9ACTN|nr:MULTISPECIES: hypothetical protein [Streptomyces]KOU06396.1 hypothetical protein ADK88_14565 [Streptomyces sp. NRRL F-2295]KOU50897.1 hypothetical protein ADK56_11975 [Streptomyces sp. MMG1522]MBD3547484.1 hypothetical protein [Streptomyces sp. JV180]QRV29160.1 hypothetical protein I6J39_19030 [Streptomyces californicus]QRV35234.1 hypothetical protein I6J42_15065 [Streptomyces californicus]